MCSCIKIRMTHHALSLIRLLYYLPIIGVNVAWLWEWHYTGWCRFWWLMSPKPSTYTVTQGEKGHTRHFAFNEGSTEHMRSPVIALKSLIADADAPDDKKTSVNICFGNWSWPWNGTLTLFSVFVDQLGLTDLHSQINLKTIMAVQSFLSFDGCVVPLCPLALQNSKRPDLQHLRSISYTSLETLFL